MRKKITRYLRRLYRAAFCREPKWIRRVSIEMAMALDPELTRERAFQEADLHCAFMLIRWHRGE